MSPLVRRLFALVLLGFAVACGGKATMPCANAPTDSAQAGTSGLILAGAARVDVTPPPGVSTFGHGPDALVSNGYWTRIYCRVFFLEIGADNRIAVIPCDLSAMSLLVQRSAANLVADILPAARVMITATHTHAAPGHYFEGKSYNDLASSRLPGYDPEMVRFLGERIAKGIRTAFEGRKAAELRWGRDDGAMWNVTHNRSVVPYSRNLEAFANGAPAHLSDELRAIDPSLTVLELREIDPVSKVRMRPIGSISFFAMHPTVLPRTNRLIGADTHGAISRLVEQDMYREFVAGCAEGSYTQQGCAGLRVADPLHGVINTNEGDIAPIWSRGTASEVVEVAQKVVSAIGRAPRTAWARSALMSSRYVEVDLPGLQIGAAPALCETPLIGSATAHGGSDHLSSMNEVEAFKEGQEPPDGNDCHNPKRPFLGCLQGVLSGGEYAFARHVPFSILRIDDTFISFVPAELTATTGLRLNGAVAEAAKAHGVPHARAIVAGLANAYVLYVATRQEYALQHYEGSQTVYGPATAEMLKEAYGLLAHEMFGQPGLRCAPTPCPIGVASSFKYETGAERARLDEGADEAPLADVPNREPVGFCRVPGGSPQAYCFRWRDGGPGRVRLSEGPPSNGAWISLTDAKGAPIRLGIPPGPTSIATSAAGWVDDRGLDFMTRVLGPEDGDGWAWTTLFRPSDEESRVLDKTPLRIRIVGTAGAATIESPVFVMSSPTIACTEYEARTCGVK